MTYYPAGREGLLEVLSWARPHDSETERRFCREYLDKVPGMTADAFGNRMLRIGDAPVMWSCHVDTVASKCGPQLLDFDPVTEIVGLAGGKAGQSLGADDGTGVWIMLNMIAARRPGLYLFHRGEERGCLGSSWLKENTPEVLEGLQAAVAFDRAGYSDVITHQSYGRTCSDAFAKSVAAQLNACWPDFDYQPDDGGIYTDTNEYAGMIPECSNLSVGYYGQHGPRETQDVAHAERLLAAMLVFDFDQCVIDRDPAVIDADDRWGWMKDDWRAPKRKPSKDDMNAYTEAVEESPHVAALLLAELGISLDDFLDEAWASDRFGDDRWQDDYRPMATA
jgi:hypothetical protein